MFKDLVKEGIASGWKHVDASKLQEDQTFETDVVIIGTGSGGGTAAEILTQAGLQVVLIEEGPLKSSEDFKMNEPEAYGTLYQEAASRVTKDKGIKVLQGRSVGGSTTINWTTSFRTPPETLKRWTELGVKGVSEAEMRPWFEQVEQRYHIQDWKVPPNLNNAAIAKGCEKLGLSYGAIRRNVKGCINLGYCGLGCPTNAKQSTLVTSIPEALKRGATLLSQARGERFELKQGRVQALECVAMNAGVRPLNRKVRIVAKHFVLAGGSIGSPAVILRSGEETLNPYGLVGKRTFLHPVSGLLGVMPEPVLGEYGAPQSIYSDHFIDTRLGGQRIGYKLESAPLQPMFLSTVLPGYGKIHTEMMRLRPRVAIIIALMRDGFHPESVGGSVYLNRDNSPGLDYPISPYVWDGLHDSLLNMAEIHFAAGATQVLPLHRDGRFYRNWQEAKSEIANLSMEILKAKVFSAHVMGGCPMGEDPKTSVVNSWGRHHEVENLSIFDGSTFPTCVAANPMESIYGMVTRQATELAKTLKS